MSDYFFSDATDLKLIILFIAVNFKRPVSISDITDAAVANDYANYFSMTQSFAELEDNRLIIPATENGKYIVTEKGKNAYDIFSNDIPYSVKVTLLNSIKKVHRRESDSLAVVCEYKESRAFGYDLYCEISEAGLSVFSMSLTLPTEESARSASLKFKKNAQKIYSDIIKNLT